MFSRHLLQSLQIHGSVQPQSVLLSPHPLHGKQPWSVHIHSFVSALPLINSCQVSVLKYIKISHLKIRFDRISQMKVLELLHLNESNVTENLVYY